MAQFPPRELRAEAEPIDVVVGRQAWQRNLLARRVYVPVGARRLPVVGGSSNRQRNNIWRSDT